MCWTLKQQNTNKHERTKGTRKLKTETHQVKSKEEVVATVDVEVFETYDEAVDFFASPDKAGEVVILELINRMHKTQKCNKSRQESTQTAKSAMVALRRRAKG